MIENWGENGLNSDPISDISKDWSTPKMTNYYEPKLNMAGYMIYLFWTWVLVDTMNYKPILETQSQRLTDKFIDMMMSNPHKAKDN